MTNPLVFKGILVVEKANIDQLQLSNINQGINFMQGKFTKINRTTSEPPTRHPLVWNAILFILHALCRQRRICFWIKDWHWKKYHPPFRPLWLVLTWNVHLYGGELSNTECIFSLPQVYLIHKQYRSLISPPPPCPYRRNKVIKRYAHVKLKNMSSAVKQQSSR